MPVVSPLENQLQAPRVCIRFMAPINQQSAHALMSVIESKVNEGVRDFKILISSQGGLVMQAVTVFNFLKGLPILIETHNIGAIHSAANVIFCAGTRRSSVSSANFLIHGVTLNIEKAQMDEKLLLEKLGGLKSDRHNISEIISKSCSISEDEIEKLMLEGKTMNPEEALELGLINEINDVVISEGESVIGIG